ncbi:MAG: beta (1-6) glucan synthase [Methylotenera sp.]|uniref:glycoside hydrolase family 17 protein n=1 Tax=Methylotenera sp. TaxID=2051956 RepID=UPI002489B83D|nr:beta (1-6) glucan synthase [Methylotenera sp.]MDI1309464.1 beta (1-6) glucan synthase [Methylotenera sp.]
MAQRETQVSTNSLPSNSSLWGFAAFNLVLLCLVSVWLWKQNQPITIPDALLNNEKIQCVSYAPYYKNGLTPLKIDTFIEPEQIDQDLALLAQKFNCVRIYSVSQGLDYVPQAAEKLGLKIYLGAWIGWVNADNDEEVNLAIKLANEYPKTIKALIIGNEVLLRGEQSEASLKKYIQLAKAQTNVPVTYADVWEFWRKHPALEASVDFVTVHILPYWEDDPQSIDHALDHTKDVMLLLNQTFKKPILIGETGWPSVGRPRQSSEPSLVNQASYIRGFLQLAQENNWQYNLIEAMDQPWKRTLEGTVGGYWGLYTSDLQPKFPFSGAVQTRQDNFKPIIFATLGAVLFFFIAYLLKEKRPSALVTIASLGSISGLSGLLQIEYLISACRNLQEWLGLGGLALLSHVIALCLILAISKPSKMQATLLKMGTIIFSLSAILASILLIVDGRYRDYAISLYLLAALELSIGLLLLKLEIEPKLKLHRILSALLLSSALYCLLLETSNPLSYVWVAINGLFVLAIWPKTLHPQISNRNTW